MKTFIICVIMALACLAGVASATLKGAKESVPEIPAEIADETVSRRNLYDKLDIGSVVTYPAFERAVRGCRKIDAAKKEILVVIDFSKPSTEERLCVIDMRGEKVLHTSHVAHGRNSGANYATSFSNKPGSHQSSLGFYVTDKTYQGGNGYSLLLNGLEEGINDKARERAIVIHGAQYCDPAIIKNGVGRLGRSFGCPALPPAKNREIIDAIKEGAILFIYADDESYKSQSRII